MADLDQTMPVHRTDSPTGEAALALLSEARQRFDACQAEIGELHALALDDYRFFLGDADNNWQWPNAIASQRQAEGRPCLTINQLPQFVRQIINDQRQNRPAIRILPATNDPGDREMSRVAQGLIRQIEAEDGGQAYMTAAEHAIIFGFGYWRVTTEHEHPRSFNKVLKLEAINDPFAVYFDPQAVAPDGSDAIFAFVFETLSREAFRTRYPKHEVSNFDVDNGWIGREQVRVADYYRVVEEQTELHQLADGRLVTGAKPKGETVVATRTTLLRRVEWHKITGNAVLASFQWPGQYLPVVPVYGRRHLLQGKVHCEGIVRKAKAAQQIYNFQSSAATELVALAPKAPFIAAEGQLEGYEDLWSSANTTSHAYLPYKPVSHGGQLLGAPQRQNFPQVPTGLIDQIERARQDLRTTTGIYQASLGAQGNETSGKAIMARQRVSDNATFDFIDNVARAIRQTGRILLDMIPHIYDTRRTVRILGDEDVSELVTLRDAKVPMWDVEAARYDVQVAVGPSYETKRIEAVASMLDFIRAVPAAGQVMGDLMAKAMDWPAAEAISKRLNALLPPPVRAADQADQPQGETVALQAQMQKMDGEARQAVEMLKGKLQQQTAQTEEVVRQLQGKLAERDRELALRERELAIKEMEIQARLEEARLKAQGELYKSGAAPSRGAAPGRVWEGGEAL